MTTVEKAPVVKSTPGKPSSARSKRSLLIAAVILALLGCQTGSSYDRGYEDGLEGTQDGFMHWINSDYRSGYADGEDEAARFDEVSEAVERSSNLREAADELGVSVDELKDEMEDLGVEP
jgi:hypothetical protein